MSYLWRLLLSFDQFLNVLLSPLLNLILPKESTSKFGNEDETISSVLGKNIKICRVCKMVCKLLALFQNKHCINSIESDEGKNG